MNTNPTSTIEPIVTLARMSGGTYDSLIAQAAVWERAVQSLTKKQEEALMREYLTPMLRCGRPASVSEERWFYKTLTNDQTAFTGFTALVEEGERLGFDRSVLLRSNAAFVEPFVLEGINGKQRDLYELLGNVQNGTSEDVASIDAALQRASALVSVEELRERGKFPLFFYATADQPLQIPVALSKRLRAITDLLYRTFAGVAAAYERNGSIELAIGTPADQYASQAFTGSVDYMVSGDSIAVIDIGVPAVGINTDTDYAGKGARFTPDIRYPIDPGTAVTLCTTPLEQQLGFFRDEQQRFASRLQSQGVTIRTKIDPTFEAYVAERALPTRAFDILTRDLTFRNLVLQSIQEPLRELGAIVPQEIYMEKPDSDAVREFTMDQDITSIVVKKGVRDRTAWKPLVTPLWLREATRGEGVRYQQFIPALLQVDVRGDRAGLRSFEIRMCYGVKQ